MNIQRACKLIVFLSCLFNICVIFAEKVPQTVVASLYALTNQWGVSGGVQQYSESRFSIEKQLKEYEDGKVILREWRMRQIDLIKENISVDKSWLREGSSELLMMAYSKMFRTSTNCWLNAAEFMGKIEHRRAEALKKWQEIESLPLTEYGFSINQVQEVKLARNTYLDLDYIIAPVAFAVTNIFPSAILPTLSAEEGTALYTNVLRRAGLVQ